MSHVPSPPTSQVLQLPKSSTATTRPLCLLLSKEWAKNSNNINKYTTDIDKKIAANKTEADKHKAKQDKVDNIAKKGLFAAGGAISTAMFGGAGLIGMASGGVGYLAANSGNIAKTIGPKIKHQDMDPGYEKIISDNASTNVGKARDGMKNDSHG